MSRGGRIPSADVGERRPFQPGRHEVADLLENPEEAFLLPHGRRFVEVPADRIGGRERAVEEADDLREADLLGGPGQLVASPLPLLALHEAAPLEDEEELLEEFRRKPLSLGDRDRGQVRRSLSPGEMNCLLYTSPS